MKKAYVKPVFMAEEFVLADSVVAACTINVNTSAPLYFDENTYMCFNPNNGKGDNGHQASDGNLGLNYNQDTSMTYWEYATRDTSTSTFTDANGINTEFNNANAYLFSSSYTTCDFVWPNSEENDMEVYVWNSWDVNLRNTLHSVGQIFAKFFYNNNSNPDVHTPGYEGSQLMS